MPVKEELLLTWLTGAYGVETALFAQVSSYLPNVAGTPELETRLVERLDRATRSLNLLDEHIARLGGATSSLQNGGLPQLMRTLKGSWHAASQSQVLRDWINSIAAEHFAIATYKALIAVAEEAGDQAVVATCRQILVDEDEMARWLITQLPAAVQGLAGEQGAKGDKGIPDKTQPISGSGTLDDEHIYAAFDDEAQARRAEQELGGMGVGLQRLQGSDVVGRLRGESGGAISGVNRSLKGSMGETQLAERYAHHVEQGRIVLAIPCDDRAQADRLMGVLSTLGAHDVSYLSASGVDLGV